MNILWTSIHRIAFHIPNSKVPVRYLNLLEYQSKNLLKKNGVAIQEFRMMDEKSTQIDDFSKHYVREYVIKAQILAGGRGKGYFDNGFKGGVHITQKRDEVSSIASKMLGHKLITHQTPSDGILVNKVMVAESVNIVRETYICIIMDRQTNGPVVVASPAGGVDIEDVAQKTPHLIKYVPIDIFVGITDTAADDLAQFLQFNGALRTQAADQIKKLWHLFVAVDATQLEINPFVETDDGKVIAVDAKINFDDNAVFRQKEVFAMDNVEEADPREVEAAKHKLSYIGMTGNIGCLVNGAGLAMATMDIIKLHGGSPANFLDLGGGVQEEQVKAAFRILMSDQRVRSILVNIFGGIVNCATIANGIVATLKSINVNVPLIVRLEGTNASEARKIISESGLNIQTAEHLDDAARKAVKSVQQ